MAGWKPKETDDSPDLTPMIDVVFLLIVFFMVVGKMITDQKIEIEPPVAEESVIPEQAGARDTVTLTKDGNLFKGTQSVTFEELTNLVQAGNNVPGYKVFLRVDKLTPHREVQKVMKACADGGVVNIIFAVYQSPQWLRKLNYLRLWKPKVY